MKVSCKILILSVVLISCQSRKSDKLDEWISTYSDLWSHPGVYLKFIGSDSLIRTRDFDFIHLERFHYKIDSTNTLILNDSIRFGKIIKHNESVLIIKDTFRTTTFLKIREHNLNTDTNKIIELLLSYDWELNESFSNKRIQFTDAPYYYGYPSIRLCFLIDESPGWERYDDEWWAIRSIGNNFFLLISRGQFLYQVYQISEITDSCIQAMTIWSDDSEEILFKIKKPLQKYEYETKKDILIGTWQLVDYKETVDSAEMIPIQRKGGEWPYRKQDSVPILYESYFQDHKLLYSFNENGLCTMSKDTVVLRNSKWDLSQDGDFIYTSSGWLPSMRIIRITEQDLTLGIHETMLYGPNNLLKESYFILTLIKNNDT